MDKKYTATELINKAVEVQNHLVDEESKQLYDIRLRYLIHHDKSLLSLDIINFLEKKYLDFTPKESALDKIFAVHNNKIDNIIIFGTGADGHTVLGLLHQTKYKNMNILFCDNDKSKWGKFIAGVKVVSPDKLSEKYSNSVVIIGSTKYEEEIYNQLISMKYFKEYILKTTWRGGIILFSV